MLIMKAKKSSYSCAAARFITSFILLASLLILPKVQAAVGDIFTDDNFKYTVLSEEGATGTVSVAKRPNTTLSGAVTIPASVASGEIHYSVALIPNHAFSHCSSLISISIPESVTSMGARVFLGCTSLVNIEVAPDNPHYSSLGGVLFNKDETVLVQYPPRKEGEYIIPEGVISFGNHAFYNCTGLMSLVLPESMSVLGQNAFYKCKGLRQIYLPPTLEAIGEDAFFGCVNLQEINIPDTVTSIGAGAFANCRSLEALDIPAYVKTIGDSAFYKCEKLKFAYIPDSCVEAGSYMFKHCCALETVIMGAGINGVQDGFFLGCGYIKEEYYQNNHGDSFFMNCGNLKEVYFLGDNPGISYDAFLVDDYRVSFNTNAFAIKAVAHTETPEYFVDPIQNKTPTLYYLNDRLGWQTRTYEEDLNEVRNSNQQFLSYALNRSLNYAELQAKESDFESDGETVISYTGNSPVVVVPDTLNGVPVTEISENAFSKRSGIYVIIIPETVTVIGERAFANCPHLKTVQFRGNAPEAPENIFEDDHCVVYYEKGTIGWSSPWKGAGVLSAEWSASGDFTYEITDNEAIITGYTGTSPYLEIPSEIEGYPVTQIGEEAFFGKYDIFRVHIPVSVTSIGFGAFANCRNLLAVELGGTTEIADSAFYYCKNLPEIILPETIEEIGNYAFLECESLKSINIPDGVSYVGNYAFDGCDKLPPILFSTGEKILVRYSPLNEDTAYTVPDTVTYIAGSAFSECNTLTDITIPESVTNIGVYAFSGCGSLTNVVIPDSVTCIGYTAFRDCSSMASVTIGNGVTEIQDEVFMGCTSLANIEIPDSVTSIGERAFAGCSNLKNIEIPDSVTEIQNGTFMKCTSLRYIIIPNNVTKIGDGAFFECMELESINIPDNVTSIGSRAFFGCMFLTSVTMGNGVTNIGNHAFSGCYSMWSITIPDGVTSIGEKAFYGCGGLISITVPDSVTTLGSGAFQICTNLTNVVMGKSVVNIGSYAFDSCYRLKSLYFKGDAPSMGSDVFSYCTALETIYYIEGTEGWTNPWLGIATATWTPGSEPTVPELAYAVEGGKFVLTFSGGSLQASSDLILWNRVEVIQEGKYEVDIPKTGKTFYRVAQ